jgi:hypothetical protein
MLNLFIDKILQISISSIETYLFYFSIKFAKSFIVVVLVTIIYNFFDNVHVYGFQTRTYVR